MRLPNLQNLTFGLLAESSRSLHRLSFHQFARVFVGVVVVIRSNGSGPSTLTHSEGYAFNKSLKGVALPSTLQTLSFRAFFNQSLEGVDFPSGLQNLTFGYYFNQPLDMVTLPSHLQSLELGLDFNQPLDQVCLPQLEDLIFGNYFNQSLRMLSSQTCSRNQTSQLGKPHKRIFTEGLSRANHGFYDQRLGFVKNPFNQFWEIWGVLFLVKTILLLASMLDLRNGHSRIVTRYHRIENETKWVNQPWF